MNAKEVYLRSTEEREALQFDLQRMTRRHRDALNQLRKTRMEVSKWKAFEAATSRALTACRADRNETLQQYLAAPLCTRRCPFRKAKG